MGVSARLMCKMEDSRNLAWGDCSQVVVWEGVGSEVVL
jgi:hypothetical protein